MAKYHAQDGRRKIGKAELLVAAAEDRTGPLLQFVTDGGGLDGVRNGEKQTLLHVAAIEGAANALALLLQSPKVIKIINSRDRMSRTALHLAAAMGWNVCVPKLVEAGAALDMQDDKGCTPLQLAVKFEWPETVRLLLESGSDPMVEDCYGHNAADIASDKRDEATIALIAAFARPRLQSAWWCFLPSWQPSGRKRPPQFMCREVVDRSYPEADHNLGRTALAAVGIAADNRHPHFRYGPSDKEEDIDGGQHCEAKEAAGQRPLQPQPTAIGAVRVHGSQEVDEMEIEWHGLDPVLVKKGTAEAAAAGVADAASATPRPKAAAAGPALGGSTTSGVTPANAGEAIPAVGQRGGRGPIGAHTTDDLSGQTGWSGGWVWNKSSRDAHRDAASSSTAASSSARNRALSAPPRGEEKDAASHATLHSRGATDAKATAPARAAAATPKGAEQAKPIARAVTEFAMFRIHAFFEEGVKRLEFEVEWREGQPSVGAVKPKGEASSRGIRTGDRLVEIGGEKTNGQSREQLLPLLKARPLLLKIDREERVADLQEPRTELELKLSGSADGDFGVEVAWCGQVAIATTVRARSPAWTAGVLEGDALCRVDGKDMSKESKSSLLAKLANGASTLTVWRRPQGMDLNASRLIEDGGIAGGA